MNVQGIVQLDNPREEFRSKKLEIAINPEPNWGIILIAPQRGRAKSQTYHRNLERKVRVRIGIVDNLLGEQASIVNDQAGSQIVNRKASSKRSAGSLGKVLRTRDDTLNSDTVMGDPYRIITTEINLIAIFQWNLHKGRSRPYLINPPYVVIITTKGHPYR